MRKGGKELFTEGRIYLLCARQDVPYERVVDLNCSSKQFLSSYYHHPLTHENNCGSDRDISYGVNLMQALSDH